MRSVGMTYNHLNLPATVTGGIGATYTYDAGGNKLKSVQGSLTVEYISGVHYKNNVLDFMSTDEGRAVRNSSTGVYKYEYSLKDHLGNARVSFDDNSGTARLIQEDEFYAFGLSRAKFVSGDKNNYLYNGKELQTALADVFDYGARFYDPVIGRWNVVDPLAEMMRRHSPYNYAFNNPMRFTDPDGMAPQSFNNYAKNMDMELGINIGKRSDGPGDEEKKKKNPKKIAEKKMEIKNTIKENKKVGGSGVSLSAGLGLFYQGLELSVGAFGKGPFKTPYLSIGVPKNPLYFNASISGQLLAGSSNTGQFNLSGYGETVAGGIGPVSGSYSADDITKPTYAIYGVGVGAGVKYTGGYTLTKTYTSPIPLVFYMVGLLRPNF
ncbi:RHS repeat domain-containing protein [Pedobacter psychroterrae]|uniref:RHS repeat-associated protein n=1 Tax=Pedobacter psychroterrae TaxID=2530453 RepID=A0A4R0NJZ4_9SPHI|nr:RHS repeat-associated core domain-containing protein [Pedobacter psychroterrae]TCC99782.1 hypothetical protein EZ437_16200 [Pedobacter psychroterrae]